MDLISHDWMIGNTYLKLKKTALGMKVKDFQKFSTNEEIYFNLQSI